MVPPYLPVQYRNNEPDYDDISFGILTEANKRGLIIIDGVHRALAALQAGMREVHNATIYASHTPPPVGPLFNLTEVSISSEAITQTPLYEGKQLDLFRPSSLFTKTAADDIMAEATERTNSG